MIPPNSGPIWITLVISFSVAFVTQLFKQLASDEQMTLRKVIATACLAGMAAVTVSSLLIAWKDVSDSFVIGISGLAGWLGAGAFQMLTVAVESHVLPRLFNKGGK